MSDSALRDSRFGVDACSSAVDPAAWDSLVERHGGELFQRRAWLDVIETNDVIDVSPRHVCLFEDGEAVAAAPMYVTRRCPKLEMFMRYYVDCGPDPKEAIAVVHSMYAQSSRILAGDAAARGDLLEAIEAAAFAECDALVFPLVAADDPLLNELRARGYETALLACTNLLDLDAESFDEYLSGLPGSRRRNVAKGRRRAREAGVAAQVESGSTLTADIAELFRRTARRHGSPEFFSERFLERSIDEFGARAHTLRIEAEGRVVGVCFCVADEDQLVPWGVGLDYDNLRRYDTYNAIYVATIELAIDQRVPLVNFGRSTYRIKAKYGCRLRPVHIAARVVGGRARTFHDWLSRIGVHAREELRAFRGGES